MCEYIIPSSGRKCKKAPNKPFCHIESHHPDYKSFTTEYHIPKHGIDPFRERRHLSAMDRAWLLKHT